MKSLTEPLLVLFVKRTRYAIRVGYICICFMTLGYDMKSGVKNGSDPFILIPQSNIGMSVL